MLHVFTMFVVTFIVMVVLMDRFTIFLLTAAIFFQVQQETMN